jgi:AraC-like DNA-binding protein
MATLLDTDLIPPRERAEAFRTAMVAASGSTTVELEQPRGGVSGRMQLWSLGTSRIFTAASTGLSLSRGSQAAREAFPEAVAIAVHGHGVGRHLTSTHQQLVRPGDLMVVDITRPFAFSWSGRGSSSSLQIPIGDLDLPLDTVQRSAEHLGRSACYGLVARHLSEITRDAERLSSGPGAAALGQATVQLVRALLVSACEGGPRRRAVLEQTLVTRARTYVDQHLRDPDLDADAVAAALGVSRRHLYRCCAASGLSLEQYIIAGRLEGARTELSGPAGRSRSIAATAFRWGFKDPTHFSRRFKAAYGLLPRDWLRQEPAPHHEPAARPRSTRPPGDRP